MTAVMESQAMRMTLVEYQAPFADRIDRENRVIRGVKILGLQSGNSVRVVGIPSDEKYEYTPEALKAAISMYEGVPVNLDHPEFETGRDGSRKAVSATKTRQRFGWLSDVEFIEGRGLFGNLEYLGNNPNAEMILEAAERKPDIFALSHNARGSVVKRDGKFVVDEIGEVRSVDLIAEKPGTTHSLFEQLDNEEISMPDVINAMKSEEETKLVPEMDNDHAEEEEMVEQDEMAAPDPAEMVESGFRAAINSLLDDDSLSDDALISKLSELVTKRAETKAVLSGGEVAEQEAEEKPEEAAAAAMSESLQVIVKDYRNIKRENETLKKESAARDLLESKNIKPTLARIKAVAALEDSKMKVELMESFQPVAKRPAVTKRPSGLAEIDEYPKDAKSFASMCRN